MTRTLLVRALAVTAALLATGEASAQSAACQRYRAELASLERDGSSRNAESAQRLGYEIARLTGYYRSIGCDRGPFLFFGGPPPAECGAIAERIRTMEASYASLSAQGGDSADSEMRRRQLRAAIGQVCQPPREAQERTPFDSLYGQPLPRDEGDDDRVVDNNDEDRTPRFGGGRLVCVRSCDGFSFPLNNLPGGRNGADEMCQALCPGTEAAAFSLPAGDDALEQAVSLKGEPYAELANAFKFRKRFDPSCACKKEGQSWADILQRAEEMLDRHRDDMVVTAQKAEELSRPRPKVGQAPARAADKKAKAKAPGLTNAPPRAATQAGAVN